MHVVDGKYGQRDFAGGFFFEITGIQACKKGYESPNQQQVFFHFVEFFCKNTMFFGFMSYFCKKNEGAY